MSETTQEQIDDAETAIRDSLSADDRQSSAEYSRGLKGLNLLLDTLAARTRELEEITAAALEVCPDSNGAIVGEHAHDPDLPRFVCCNEDGDPIIEAETVAEVIHGMSSCWAATQERAEKAERELEEMRKNVEAVERWWQTMGKDVWPQADGFSATVSRSTFPQYDPCDETVASAPDLLALGKLLREREGK